MWVLKLVGMCKTEQVIVIFYNTFFSFSDKSMVINN